MSDKKARGARLAYNIAFCVDAAALVVLVIVQAWRLYFAVGKGNFTRELVSSYIVKPASIPFWIMVALVIVGAVLWAVKPPEGKKRQGMSAAYSLYRLKKKLPVKAEGELLKEAEAVAKYDKILKIVWGLCAAVCVIFAAAGLAYLCDGSHFSASSDSDTGRAINRDVINAVINVFPFVVCALALCIGAVIYGDYSAKQELPHLKKLVAEGKKIAPEYNKAERFYYAAVAAIESNKSVWIIRGTLAVIGVLFIILGVENGGATDVLKKAVAICDECIGLA